MFSYRGRRGDWGSGEASARRGAPAGNAAGGRAVVAGTDQGVVNSAWADPQAVCGQAGFGVIRQT